VGLARNNIALVLYAEDRHAEAEEEYRRALAVMEEALGPEHPHVAIARSNFAQVLLDLGKLDDAETEHREALAVQERAFGAEHPDVARARNNLGQILATRRAYPEAEVEIRLALALWEKGLGADHANVAIGQHNLAKVLLAAGKAEEAVPLVEKAWERRQRDDALPEQRASSGFLLARALWQASKGASKAAAVRERARGLAEQARDGFAAAGKRKDAAEVEGWLARPDAWVPASERAHADR
jgi:tetratricopeptide (TPR) repeat protein